MSRTRCQFQTGLVSVTDLQSLVFKWNLGIIKKIRIIFF